MCGTLSKAGRIHLTALHMSGKNKTTVPLGLGGGQIISIKLEGKICRPDCVTIQVSGTTPMTVQP